jgi:hypothetical protein
VTPGIMDDGRIVSRVHGIFRCSMTHRFSLPFIDVMSAIEQKHDRHPSIIVLFPCHEFEVMSMPLVKTSASLPADAPADLRKKTTAPARTTPPAASRILPYDPNRLLDTVAERLGISGDRMLSRMLQLSLQIIGGMRSGSLPVRASMLLAIAECAGTSVDELRHILGDRRSKARMTFGTLAV